jgi:nitrite reductase/ring-hydroxylating ferredoxin subunit
MKNSWIFLVVFLATGCRDRNTVLPEQSFYIQFNVNEPAFFDLTVPSGWVYYNGSEVDLILYRATLDEVIAYDSRSTHDIDAQCLVAVTDDNVIIEDPCSGSQWIITDGSVITGPASLPLLTYEVSFNGSSGNCVIQN